MQQIFNFFLEFHEVARCDETLPRLLQTVSDKLDQLVLNEAQHAVSKRRSAVWREVFDHGQQPPLHLSRGLRE